jgi:uncharacterized protein HemY
MMFDIFLVGYVLPVMICLISAAWLQWFSYDMKATLGAFITLVAAFVPLGNILFVILVIADIPRELKDWRQQRKQRKTWYKNGKVPLIRRY